MTKEEYRSAIDEVIYLCSCVVNGEAPDKERIDKVNLEHLYKAAEKHSLSAIVAYALESAGVFDHAFIQAKAKAIRKVTVMEIDKELLFERFEQEEIWYLPLKGIVIKDLYPSIGLRQMADFDILYDVNYQKRVREIFTELGYTCQDFNHGDHDVYFKQPVSNFEMHTSLFGLIRQKEIEDYYRDIRHLMQKDDNNAYGYHFSSTEFYVYIISHEFKHYTRGGTGLRSLLDSYVIWQRLGDELDVDDIRTRTERLCITEFEQKNKKLALDLFSGSVLSEEEQLMLEYVIGSGTYGNPKNDIDNKIDSLGGGKIGKRKYIISRIILPMDAVKYHYPFFYRHKLLLPGLFFYRLGRALTVNRKKTKAQLKILKENKKRSQKKV